MFQVEIAPHVLVAPGVFDNFSSRHSTTESLVLLRSPASEPGGMFLKFGLVESDHCFVCVVQPTLDFVLIYAF